MYYIKLKLILIKSEFLSVGSWWTVSEPDFFMTSELYMENKIRCLRFFADKHNLALCTRMLLPEKWSNDIKVMGSYFFPIKERLIADIKRARKQDKRGINKLFRSGVPYEQWKCYNKDILGINREKSNIEVLKRHMTYDKDTYLFINLKIK